jgi:hypothetical protein
VPWTYWLFLGLMLCVVLTIGAMAVIDEIRGRRDPFDEDDWRDYTGWGR